MDFEDIEYECLRLLLQIYARKHPTGTMEAEKIFNEVLKNEGLDIFAASGDGSKGEKVQRLALFFDKEDMKKADIFIDEVKRCMEKDVQTKSGHTLYIEDLQQKNSAYFRNLPQVKENVLNMFLNFQICLVEAEKVDISDIETNTPQSPSQKGNHLFTLLDPYLKYDQFTKMGVESEWTHQIPITCIVVNACLNHDNLIFRTNEPFKRSNEYLSRALSTCKIQTLSSKTRLHGDTHVITPLFDSCYHVCLVMEHQRENCAQVWDHKDLAKIILLMRTCLKTSIVSGCEKEFKVNNLNTLGILSSRDHIFLLNMKANFLSTNNISNGRETIGVQYDLSIESFSSTNESRNNFAKTLTARFRLFKQIESEKKQFCMASSPWLSRSIINKTSDCMNLISFDSCLNQSDFVNRTHSIKDFLQTKFPKHVLTFTQYIERETFSKATKDCTILLFGEIMNDSDIDVSKYNLFIVAVKNDATSFIGYTFRKNQVTVNIQVNSENEDDNESDSDDGDDSGTHQDGDNKKRKRENNSGNQNKKKKSVLQDTFIASYSANLKSITEKYNINSKKVRKFKSNCKIGLYAEIENQFLKIIHYFDHSSENLKGMNIVKSIEHDNISKILEYERQTINVSQMRELFVEEFIDVDESNTFTVFITLSEWVVDSTSFVGNLKSHNLKSKLLCFVKMVLDVIDGINTLHENNVIHGDISLFNIGFRWFSLFSKTKYSKEKLKVAESIYLPRFDLVLLDLNHCKVEGQEQATSNMFRDDPLPDLDNIFFPFSTMAYCPVINSLQFQKEHDIYSCSLVLAQIFLQLFDNVPWDSLNVWMKEGNLKDKLLEKLTSKEIVMRMIIHPN